MMPQHSPPYLLGTFLFFGLVSCKLADLRTPELLKPFEWTTAEKQGRALLEKVAKTAGGRKRWKSFDRVDFDLEDEWQGILGWLFRPWPDNPSSLYMSYKLGMKEARCKFLRGSQKGMEWETAGSQFWVKKEGQPRQPQRRENARFILRAYQFFFELPFQIHRADIVLYAGKRKRGAKVYDLVFATWGTPAPHSNADQYLLWIARDTGCLEIAQYTIREKYDFATGINRFSDFRRVQGLLLPHRYWIASDLEDTSYIHQARLSHLVFHRRDGPNRDLRGRQGGVVPTSRRVCPRPLYH